jgi:uncharacterized glyoxalase superfamily protein PhnB
MELTAAMPTTFGRDFSRKSNKAQALAYYRKVIDANNPKFLENALIYTADSGIRKRRLPHSARRLL